MTHMTDAHRRGLATGHPQPKRREPPSILDPRFSQAGLAAAMFFAAVSLLPSLLPRDAFIQGVASGVTFMVGYGVGTSGRAIWGYLGMPPSRGRVRVVLLSIAYGLAILALSAAVWQFVGWQNEIRRSFGMADLTPAVWPIAVGVALSVAFIVLIASRLLRLLFRTAGNLLDRWLPRRLAITLATAFLLILLYLLVSGLLVRGFFTVANAVFSAGDRGDKAGVTQPADPARSGGADSSVLWEDLGRQGRAFVSGGPGASEINEFSGGGALEPVRVYVGLRSASTLQARADLLLEELQRTGAFDREVLVVATTTGTGWLDSNGIEPLEYLWNGDTAIAGVQYSFLPSWISLLADQEAARETSTTVFRTVYDYWAALPQEDRPALYLYGLSLGSYGVEAVLGNIDIINEPIDGALMVGPPFVNSLHAELVDARDQGSTPWLPIVSEGRTVRFATEDGGLDAPTGPWGPTRLVYLQHGSDPVVFFSPNLAWSEPAWLHEGQRAPDVSTRMTWFPIVTMWQTLLDLPSAQSVPEGYGHLYSIHANLQAWANVTQAPGWTSADTDRLAAHLELRRDERASLLDTWSN